MKNHPSQEEILLRIEKSIPAFVSHVTTTLTEAGFEAHLVGGSIRDLVRGVPPKDWDVATNALPSQIEELFDDTYKENELGTVGVKVTRETESDISRGTVAEKDIVEVTTYRSEGTYSDARRPDEVTFVKSIQEDLSRRDFTVNAIAYNPVTREIVDPFGGIQDVSYETIQCVGRPEERFREDALRMLRAIRLQVELGYNVSYETLQAVQQSHHLLQRISCERIRDEFNRILLSPRPAEGVFILDKTELLQHIIPELLETKGVEQGGAHAFDVWNHLVRSLQHTADKQWGIELRLAALLHDIAKPQTRGKGKHKQYSFYGHEVVGAKMSYTILKRLKYPKKIREKVVLLIRHHMFLSDPDAISHSAIRRLMRRAGKENLQDLIKLRMADRIGTGRPVEEPYRLRKFQAMIDEVASDPITVGMLTVTGNDIMEHTNEKPGPRIGYLLHALLQEVIEDPQKNTKEYLLSRALTLHTFTDEELKKLGEEGKEKREEVEQKRVQTIYKKRGTHKEV